MKGLALAGLALLAVPAAALGADEQRGRLIFETGAGVEAILPGGAKVPGRFLPCAGCHGADRRGRPEGTVRPPDVSWANLTRSGRVAYDAAFLGRALRDGMNAEGRPMDGAMPRWVLSDAALADLAAWMRHGHAPADPGVADDSLTIAVALPDGPAALAVRRLTLARLAGTEFYGRRIHVLFAQGPEGLGALVGKQPVFAVMGADPGVEKLPVLGPLGEASPSATVFRLTPGLRDREALAARTGGRLAVTSAADLDPAEVSRLLSMVGPIDKEAAAVLLEAHAAISVLLEALKRAGRDLNRQRLVAALEGLRDFRTGALPPISFGPDRRVGTGGMYVLNQEEGRGGAVSTPPRWVSLP